MNTANILRVADAIEQSQLTGVMFNMTNWVKPADWVRRYSTNNPLPADFCGTAACIAGYVQIMINLDDGVPSARANLEARVLAADDPGELEENAADFLGLSINEAQELFRGGGQDIDLESVTASIAVAVLRDMAERNDGTPRWEHFGAKVHE